MKYFAGLVLLFASSPCMADEIDFRKAYAAAVKTKSANIDVSKGDVLVFTSGPPIVLHGKRLLVTAPVARLESDFHIIQYDEGDVPADVTDVGLKGNTGSVGGRNGRNGAQGGTGDPGGDGPIGRPGRDAPSIILDISQVTGPGQLFINNDGGKGGKGGQGGKGGTGGQGGGGAGGSDALAGCKAGGADGGPGGTGGTGGVGGRGGTGGAGGDVRVSRALDALRSAKRLTVTAKGGQGGLGGEPGIKGDPGGGGNGGGGSKWCGGGSGGGSGSYGAPGTRGNEGLRNSKNGTISIIDPVYREQ